MAFGMLEKNILISSLVQVYGLRATAQRLHTGRSQVMQASSLRSLVLPDGDGGETCLQRA